MLIPMYFLIGIWGHDRRIYAAVKFILYTMFGSILMLVAILWLYNLSRHVRPAGHPESKLQAGHSLLPPRTELCSSARSSWPLPSRSRSSRCTPGCRTRTPKRPPPAP